MRTDVQFTNTEENESLSILSLYLTRITKIKFKANKIIGDFRNIRSTLLINLADRIALIITGILALEDGAVIPTQCFILNNGTLRLGVDLVLANTRIQIDEESANIIFACVEKFIMMSTSTLHGTHQTELWQTLSDEQLALLQKHSGEFLTVYGDKKIATPILIRGMGEERILKGTFLPKIFNHEIETVPYDVLAHMNGLIFSERELHLLLGNGNKLEIYYDAEKHLESLLELLKNRHKPIKFKICELPNKKKGKTFYLVDIDDQDDKMDEVICRSSIPCLEISAG